MTVLIPGRFNGPANSGNGGVTAGLLAATLDADGPVQVTLRRPPPLDRELTVEHGRLLDGDVLVADACAVDVTLRPVPPVSFVAAAEAATRFDGFRDHPFATCVGCGTDRTDGLACYAGAVVPGDLSRVATPFVPRQDLPRNAVLVWTALDCPGGWSIGLVGRRAVLGRMTATVFAVPAVGEECVVVGQCDGWDGRKAFSRSSLYGHGGQLLGLASATWVELR